MGPHLLALALTLSAPQQGADSQGAFASRATEAIIRLAMARHAAADTTVHDYQASFRTRLTFSFGRRAWARIPPMAAEEQTGIIRWQRPNDLQIEMRGRRERARNPDMQIRSVFDSPWFVPRALDDSVRVAGADFPEEAALHPLAADGPDWYHYALTDSVAVHTADGQVLNLYRITVTPRRVGKGLTLGYLMIDGASGEVVRFTFRFVGTSIWVAPDSATPEDSADAREGNKWIGRLLTLNADLEYSLQDRVHWMPYRQTISGSVEIPFVGDAVVPFSFSTTFDDYEIDTGRPIVFRMPQVHSKAEADSIESEVWDSISGHPHHGKTAGEAIAHDTIPHDSMPWKTHGRDVPGVLGGSGRYEVHIPPLDSMDHYSAWGDTLKLDLASDDEKELRDLQGQIAGMAEHLPSEMTGHRFSLLSVPKFADLFRFTRVQGLSLGAGYKTPFFHVPFATAFVNGRFGFSDTRVYARAAIVRDAPGGRWTLVAYRDLELDDPFFAPKAVGNSVNGIWTAHDEADYYLGHGASLSYETSVARGRELTITGRLEDVGSVKTEAHSAIADIVESGDFDPNPSVRTGTFAGVTARLEGTTGLARWMFGAELLGKSGEGTAKLVGEWKQRVNRGKSGLSLTGRAGIATDNPLPQSAFRLGGEATVRGFPYGALRGQAFWAAQADIGIGHKNTRPVLFADAGQAGPRQGFFARQVITGAGAGVSFFGGFCRLDLSFPIHPSGGDPRFDIVFNAPR